MMTPQKRIDMTTDGMPLEVGDDYEQGYGEQWRILEGGDRGRLYSRRSKAYFAGREQASKDHERMMRRRSIGIEKTPPTV